MSIGPPLYKIHGADVCLLLTSPDVAGSSQAKRGILVIYDVFGYYIQALKGADILAYDSEELPDGSGDFQIFMPDFFGDHPQDLANFPPKSPKQFKAIYEFMKGPADPSKNVDLVGPFMKKVMQEHQEIETWGIVGFCWGGKIAALVSQKDTIFKAAAQCHPSLLSNEDAGKVEIPMCILPSQDEVPEVSEVSEVNKWAALICIIRQSMSGSRYLRRKTLIAT